ncbi:hypothetical protein OAN307_c06920 [Octadecabacter antarcticus 307]|uniref:Cation/multidrug efflux pump n=1 Tax=Octadecabacter antarcticus 307 TaxID=391626 RepID=M9R1A8_9RHOB|nr:hypothetical protein [Octadecabacter antarcticus]AGI66419.1 hypothetical protein OAN307_c06920 [Octadecabacter antarcticus 307]
MGFVRLVLGGFVILGVVYICVTLYSRSVRREKLEGWWDEEPVEAMTREAYIADGMAKYENGLRKRLILLVFIIPPIIVGTIIYFIN